MSFVAAATAIGLEGMAATIGAGAMMGGAMKVGTNVLSGKGAFDNIGQGILMGGITGGIAPEVAQALDISTAAAAGLTSGALTGLATGSLSQGLMTGLGTYGLASLPGASTEGTGGTGDTTYQIRNASGTSMDPSVSKFASPTPEPSFDTSDYVPRETTTQLPASQPVINNEPTNITEQLNQAAVQRAPVSFDNVSNIYTGGPAGSTQAMEAGLSPPAPTGINGVKLSPPGAPSTGIFSGLKDKFMALPGYQQAGIGAAGLMALKGMAKSNTVAKAPDNRKIKYYGGNPYSGAGFMREIPAVAANGGIVALANGGGVKGFAGNDGSAVWVPDSSLDEGGISLNPSQLATYAGGRYADAGAPAPAPVVAAPAAPAAPATQVSAVQAAINAGRKGFAPGTSAQDIVNSYGIQNSTQAQQVAQALGYTGDIGSLTYSAPAAAPATATASVNYNDPASVLTALQNGTVTQKDLISKGYTTPDQTYLNSIMNPTAGDLSSLDKATAADKAALINKAINAANNVSGGNNATSQKVIAQLMDVWKINPDTVQSALGNKYTGPSVQSLYSAVDPALAMGVTSSWANQGAYNPAAAVKSVENVNKLDSTVPVVDPNAFAASLGLKGTYKTLSDVATALGLPSGDYKTASDITKAITALSVTPKAPVAPPPLAPPVNLAPVQNLTPTTTVSSVNKNGFYVPATGPTTTNNGQTYTPGYISNTANATTAPGISGSHASVNPNGSISQSPALAFKGLGGYGTIKEMNDAYAKAGGSPGYVNPKPVARNIDAGTQHYLDMLSGDAPMSKVPYTPTGEIAKPYYTSVMGMAENPKYTVSQPKIYDSSARRYVDNPNYDPAFSATADYVGDAQTGLSQKTKDFFTASGTKDPSVDTKTISKALANSVPEDAPSFGSNAPADFDSEAYLKAHPDVAAELANGKANFGSAYGHYLMYGDKGSKVKDAAYAYTKKSARGGLMGLAGGGLGNLGGYSDGGRLLRGPGDGISDSIPATIGNRQPARLADGEFVVPARIVSELGNGSTEAGARKLYQMMDRVQNARKKTTGKKQVAANPRAEQYLPV